MAVARHSWRREVGSAAAEAAYAASSPAPQDRVICRWRMVALTLNPAVQGAVRGSFRPRPPYNVG